MSGSAWTSGTAAIRADVPMSERVGPRLGAGPTPPANGTQALN